jgi:hypothetical protein
MDIQHPKYRQQQKFAQPAYYWTIGPQLLNPLVVSRLSVIQILLGIRARKRANALHHQSFQPTYIYRNTAAKKY